MIINVLLWTYLQIIYISGKVSVCFDVWFVSVSFLFPDVYMERDSLLSKQILHLHTLIFSCRPLVETPTNKNSSVLFDPTMV